MWEAERRWSVQGFCCGRGRVRVLRVRWVGFEVAVRRMRWAMDRGIMVVGVYVDGEVVGGGDDVYMLRVALGFELG